MYCEILFLNHKDQNESNDSGINKSGAADDKIHMKVESIEITEAKNNINIKEIETNEHTLKISSTEI